MKENAEKRKRNGKMEENETLSHGKYIDEKKGKMNCKERQRKENRKKQQEKKENEEKKH